MENTREDREYLLSEGEFIILNLKDSEQKSQHMHRGKFRCCFWAF